MYSELLKYSKTYGPMQGDFSDWHKGRQKYAVWILEPNHEEFVERYQRAQQHLSSYLIDDYQRKPHITLAPCGFLVPERAELDDYDNQSIENDVSLILDLNWQAVDVMLRNVLISYAIAPGFEVLDSQGQLSLLNQLLAKKDPLNDGVAYFPHVTTGLYNNEWATSLIVDELRKFPIEENMQLTLDVIKLVSYAPTVSGGELKDELIINLADQSIIRY